MMEAGITASVVLDHALVRVQSSRNRYEALACWHGQTEKLVTGSLHALAIHLPEARSTLSNKAEGGFKLAIDDSANGSWFTKSTLSSFLHIVNAGDVLKNATEIENEMSQLEQTKRFEVNLYAKDEMARFDDVTDMHSHLVDDIVSSDSTKNDLLRAMDLRLTVLKEDLVATFNRATGSSCSTKEVADLAAFAEHFGATLLRNFCLKILPLFPEAKMCDSAHLRSGSSGDRNEDETMDIGELLTTVQESSRNNISPAKAAKAERESTTESEESSDSSGEDQPVAERSRPLIRSASPRRSASPMRRIQIGRSGSRRSTALTIKSLNHFPAREKSTISRNTDVNVSGDEESEQPSKKSENTVRRMSVQDAITLFESKQKDQNSDVQRRATSEISAVTNKSVLRRWSAGMGDSFNQSSQENTSGNGYCNDSNSVAKSEAEKVKGECVNIVECPKPVQTTEKDSPLENDTTSHLDNSVMPSSEETNGRAAVSAEWAREKEAELNEIIMKMMENKPGKYGDSNAVSDGCQDIFIEHRGDFYSQYKEKREEKLRAENGGKRAVKEAQIKVMKKTLEQSKAGMASKNSGKEGKRDSNNHPQRFRTNSSSPTLTKKEGAKPFSSRKASPKLSPLPTTCSSLSAGTPPRSSLTPQTKSVPITTRNQRKSQPASSPIRPSPRIEKQFQQPRVKKGTVANVKPSSGSQEIGQQKRVTKSTKNIRNKEPPTPEVESTVQPSNPSFYNKVARKSTVVPLEPKPFLKKGARSSTRISAALGKAKSPQLDECSKNGEPMEEEQTNSMSTAELNGNTAGEVEVQPTDDNDASTASPKGNDFCTVRTESPIHDVVAADDTSDTSVQNPSQDIQQDIQSEVDLEISSSAWVEAERQEIPASESNTTELAGSPEPAPMPSTSPHIRHSLSQMLQADSCEPEIIEWGNAENPPALVYQKDAPKGLKRLLKFARKSKGDANVIGWSTHSVFSEGEDDQEEAKASKRSSDIPLRKSIQARSHGQQNTLLSESFDGGNSSKRSSYNQGSAGFGRLRDGNNPDATTSIKGSRSFFSLSTFRSSKSSEPKLRR